MNGTPDFQARMEAHAGQVTDFVMAWLATRDLPPRLGEAIRYSVSAGGKRIRPVLVMESASACGAPGDAASLAAAGAIELIHTFSLVHDDLPAMDDDDLRRGRPTNHIVFGEAMAILAGDGMTTLAFELLAEQGGGRARELIRELASASTRMIAGQTLDMEAEGRSLSLEELKNVHRLKTGALLTAACRMGGLSAGASASQMQALTAYGEHLGLAFQIADDLLDQTATPEELGKQTGKDGVRGKNTYPALMGLARARAEAEHQLKQGVAAVELFGAAADFLRDLAWFVVHRRR